MESTSYSVVAPITQSTLPRTYQYTETVTKVINTSDDKHRVEQTNYVVTVYDINGQLGKYTNVNTIDYLVWVQAVTTINIMQSLGREWIY